MSQVTEIKRPGEGHLIQGLGLTDATAIVVGSMIGSGIFIVSADISQQVNSPGLLIMTWVVTAVMTLIAALSYGELAAMMPYAGGQYVYLREAFGKLPAFLYGWTLFFVIQTGTIAAVAVAFAKFTGVFLPFFAASNIVATIGAFTVNTQQLLAIGLIVFLTFMNSQGVREGALIQNIFTWAKVLALLLLIGLGLTSPASPGWDINMSHFWQNSSWSWDTIRIVGVAMVGALFSSDAWNNVTFTAGETRNPKRNVPLSLALGVGLVSLLYISCNFIYLRVLPLEAIQGAAEQRVGTAAAAAILGSSAAKLMAAAIMISTFGCVNGLTLAGPRVYYSMAKDGLFLKAAAKLNPHTNVPVAALIMQCVWGCLLTLSGKYGDLLDYVIFAVLLFYILTIVGLFVLRAKRPDAERPYRAFGYPFLPGLYVALATLISVLLLVYKPTYTWPGLLIVALGVPVYLLTKRRG